MNNKTRACFVVIAGFLAVYLTTNGIGQVFPPGEVYFHHQSLQQIGDSWTVCEPWEWTGGTAQCGASVSTEVGDQGWDIQGSVSVNILWLSLSGAFTPPSPPKIMAQAHSNNADGWRVRAIWCKTHDKAKYHERFWYNVIGVVPMGPFGPEFAHPTITTTLILTDQVRQGVCEDRPSQWPTCKQPRDKEGNVSYQDANPCRHQEIGKDNTLLGCPYPSWVLPKKQDNSGSEPATSACPFAHF